MSRGKEVFSRAEIVEVEEVGSESHTRLSSKICPKCGFAGGVGKDSTICVKCQSLQEKQMKSA